MINPDTLEDESVGLRWEFGSVAPGTVFVVRDRDTGEDVARIPVESMDVIEIPSGVLKDGHTYETGIVTQSSCGCRSYWSSPVTFQPDHP